MSFTLEIETFNNANMTTSKGKRPHILFLFLPLIAAIYILGGCGGGGGSGDSDWPPSASQLESLTYIRPVDDDLPLGEYHYTFVSETFDANTSVSTGTYTETQSNTSGAYTYQQTSKTEATLTFDRPGNLVTDTLTFTAKGMGTFISDESDGVTGSFTLN